MLGYRYSTSGYHDFSEANGDGYSNWSTGHQDKEERRAYEAWRGKYTKRSRTQANINQSLGDYGSLYLSVYEQQYWEAIEIATLTPGLTPAIMISIIP